MIRQTLPIGKQPLLDGKQKQANLKKFTFESKNSYCKHCFQLENSKTKFSMKTFQKTSNSFVKDLPMPSDYIVVAGLVNENAADTLSTHLIRRLLRSLTVSR